MELLTAGQISRVTYNYIDFGINYRYESEFDRRNRFIGTHLILVLKFAFISILFFCKNLGINLRGPISSWFKFVTVADFFSKTDDTLDILHILYLGIFKINVVPGSLRKDRLFHSVFDFLCSHRLSQM